MGIDIATAVPKANSRMTIAAAMPITSLISVPCWETSVPRYPPTPTRSPASVAGAVASMTSWGLAVRQVSGGDVQQHGDVRDPPVPADLGLAGARQRAHDLCDVRRLLQRLDRRVDGGGVLGVGDLSARRLEHHRVRAVRLRREPLREQLLGLLAVVARKRQVVARDRPDGVCAGAQRDYTEDPCGEHDVAPPHRKLPRASRGDVPSLVSSLATG